MKQKQHKNITTWNKALKSFDGNIINEGRLKLGIPKNGFKNQEEFDTWDNNNQFYENRLNIQPKSGKGRVLLDDFEGLVESISKMSQHINNGFYLAIWEHVFYDEVSEKTLIESNSSGCEVIFINKSSENFVDDGVYVKIGPHSNTSDIKDFLHKNTRFIKDLQKIYKAENNVGKIINTKSEFFERNKFVKFLNSKSIYDLQTFLNFGSEIKDAYLEKQRHFLGARIMTKIGYKMTPDNFKSIAYRESKKVTQK